MNENLIPASDDSVPVITDAPYKEGWRNASLMAAGRREEVLVAPNGTRYVFARADERADLIVDLTRCARRLGRLRLRREDGSRQERKAKREARLTRRGEAKRQGRKRD